MTDSDSDQEIFTPIRKKRVNRTTPALPVQLTWKGIQIYFPSVVLSQELKEKADAALKIKIAKQSLHTAKNALPPEERAEGSESSRAGSSISNTLTIKREHMPSTSTSAKNQSSNSLNECKICGISFHSDYALTRHALSHTNLEDKKYGPCKCGAKFSKRFYFNKHKNECRVNKAAETKSDCTDTGGTSETIRVKLESVEDFHDLHESCEDSQIENNKTDVDVSLSKETATRSLDIPEDDSHHESPPDLNDDSWENEEQQQIPVLTSVVSTARDAHKCERCGSQFGLNVQFIHHKRLCQKMCQKVDELGRARKHTCPICPWRFVTTCQLKRHSSLHNGSLPFKCDTCLQGFPRKDYLANHKLICGSSNNPTGEPITVSAPLSQFETTSQNLPQEKDQASPKISEEIMDCPFCSESFPIKIMDSHLKTHPTNTKPTQSRTTVIYKQNPGTSKVTCNKCNRTFTAMRYFKTHACRVKEQKTTTTATTQRNSPFNLVSCPYCKSAFTKYFGAVRHMRNSHKCMKCGLDFVKTEDKFSHSGGCSSSVSSSSDVFTRFRCPVCSVAFSPPELIRHIQSHKESTNSSSDLMQFTEKTQLSIHSSSHVAKQPAEKLSEETSQIKEKAPKSALFVCKFHSCTHFFSHDEDLWYHVDKKHKSVGNICCGQCGQDFGTEQLVNEHEQKAHNDIEVLPPQISSVISPNQPSTSTANSTKIKWSIPLKEKVIIKNEREEFEQQHNEDDFYDSVPEQDEVTNQTKQHNPCVLINTECRQLADTAMELGGSLVYSPVPEWAVDIPYQDVYVCRQCYDLKTFEYRDLYIKHLSEEHRHIQNQPLHQSPNNKIYTCHLCPQKTIFKTGVSFRNHIKHHKRTGRLKLCTRLPLVIPIQDEYFCKICDNKRFTDSNLYRNHIKYHRSLKRKTGSEIPSPFSPRLLRPDIPVSPEYECTICENGRKYPGKERAKFLAHMRNHEKNKGVERPVPTTTRRLNRPDIPIASEYECTICERKFPGEERATFLSHLRSHGKVRRDKENKLYKYAKLRPDIPIQETYTCTICVEKKFNCRLKYVMHLKYHEKLQLLGKDGPTKSRSTTFSSIAAPLCIPFESEYYCQTCDRKFAVRREYVNHVKYHLKLKKIEGEDRPIAQGIGPGRGFMKRLDIPVQDVYTCDLCDETDGNKNTFTIRAEYLRHRNSHTTRQQKVFRSNNHWRRRQPAPNSWQAKIPYSNEYSCETCPERTFNDRMSYIGHIQYHRILMKKGCNRVIPSKEEFLKNREKHKVDIKENEQGEYTCDICNDGRTFPNSMSLVAHRLYHDRLKRQGVYRPLKKRWEKTYPDQDEYSCDICGPDRTFTKKLNYIVHLRYHERIKNEEGHDRRIRTKDECTELRRSRHPNKADYSCEICNDGRTFKKASYFSHMAYHEKRVRLGIKGPLRKRETATNSPAIPVQSVYRCKQCTPVKPFSDRKKFILHVQYHKFKQKSIIATKNSGLLHNPVNSSGADSYEKFSCTLCGEERVFSSREQFMLHIRKHKLKQNDSTEKFSCTLCGEEKVFTSKEAYKKHLGEHKATKKKDFQFQCSMCEKSFSNMWNLKSHAKSHTGEKTFICGDCGKRFMTNSILQQHQKSLCKKIPCKYTCYCSEKFHTVDSLERHVKRVHTTPEHVQVVSKIFRCYVCDDQFLQAFELDEHVRLSHPVDYEEFMRHRAEKQGTTVEDEPEPLYPEVVMDCIEGENSNDDDYAGMDTTPNYEIPRTPSPLIVGNGGWNYIPGLTGDDASDAEEQSEEEEEANGDFLLEPEDVEIEGSNNVERVSEYVPSPSTDSHEYESPNVSRRQSLEENEKEWIHSGKKNLASSSNRRSFKSDGQFQCGYCDKQSHRLAYIKTHFSVHQGLPFKFINLQSGEKCLDNHFVSRPRKRRILPIASVIPQPQPSTSLQAYSAFTIQPPPNPMIVNVSSQISQTQTTPVAAVARRRSSNNSDKQKSAPICTCAFDPDSICGYFKRCTGEGCACYIRYKGCSDECDCKRSCGNPYFRTKPPAPPRQESVQVSHLASLISNTSSQKASFTGQDAINSIIENAFKKDAVPSTPTSSNSSTTQAYTFAISNSGEKSTGLLPSYNQVLESGDITGYANPSFNLGNSFSQSGAIINVQSTHTTNTNFTVIPAHSKLPITPLIPTYNNATHTPPNNNVPPPILSMLMKQNNVRYQTQQGRQNQVIRVKVSAPSTAPPATVTPTLEGVQIYRCFCHQDFKSLTSFLWHQWTHKQEKLFLCAICKKQYTTVKNLINHSKTHTDVEPITLHPCTACELLLSNQGDYDRHFLICHKDLICDICNVHCNSRLELATHRQVHGTCNICHLTFFNQSALRSHLSRDHADITQSQTSSVPYASSQLSNGTVTFNRGNVPEVVDLEDDEDEISPQFPIIVSVAGTPATPAHSTNYFY